METKQSERISFSDPLCIDPISPVRQWARQDCNVSASLLILRIYRVSRTAPFSLEEEASFSFKSHLPEAFFMKRLFSYRFQFIFSMAIFGTMGLFSRYVPLPSSVISMVRGILGSVFLLLLLKLQGKGLNWAAIRKNLLPLCFSGVCLACDWILFLEAYRYTTVAVATLCYYLAPAFVVLLSPFLLKERLTALKVACVGVAVFGMVLVSGVIQSGGAANVDLRGVICALIAACFYATIVILNKKLTDLGPMDRTVMQLTVCALVLIPYNFVNHDMTALHLDGVGLAALLTLAIVHTGVSYALYFGSFQHLSAQAVALFSYVDPVVAVFVSALLLPEPMDALCALGAVLVLGSTMFGELWEERHAPS